MRAFEGKLILTDMDGTLLNEKDRISPETRAAVDRFIDGGGLFSVATGRSKKGMEHFFPELRVNAPAVLYNGSVIYDFSTGKDLYTCCVGEKGSDLVRLLQERFPQIGIEVYAEHCPYVAQESDYTRSHFLSVKIPWNPCPPERIPQPWLSMVITGERPVLEQARALAEESGEGYFFTQFSGNHMVEIMRYDANKGSAAQRLRELLGVRPEDLYTAGDGPNDIQLLECAYHSCAPENAQPELLAIARHILPDNSRHTIARLIDGIERGIL